MATIHEIDIRKYTWWVSSDKRLFFIAEIRSAFNEETKAWVPETIGLFDAFSEEIVYRPWDEICQLYDSKSLQKPTPYKIEEYKSRNLIKL